MGELRIVSGKGDTKIIWDAEQEDEVDNARRTFRELRNKGYLAYSVKGRGKQGDQVFDFDPDAEKLILVPPMQGG